MSIKIAMLQSGEDVIADIKEIITEDPNTGEKRTVGYQFDKPYIVKLSHPEILIEDEKSSISILFYPWAPLSIDKQFFIPENWVITMYNAHSDIVNSYLEKQNGGRDDRHDGGIDGESSGTESNQVYSTEES